MRSLQPDHSLFNWSSNPPDNLKMKKMKNKLHHPHWGIKKRSSVSFLLKVKGLKPHFNQFSSFIECGQKILSYMTSVLSVSIVVGAEIGLGQHLEL